MTTNFGQALRTLRNKRHLTEQQLADAVGLAKSTISMYECSCRLPSHKALERIADYFDVSMDYLFGREKGGKTNE